MDWNVGVGYWSGVFEWSGVKIWISDTHPYEVDVLNQYPGLLSAQKVLSRYLKMSNKLNLQVS